MNRVNTIFIYFSLGLSFFMAHGQQIGNYVNNGSFEDLYTCQLQPSSQRLKNWSCLDSSKVCALVYHKCWGNMPNAAVGIQYPKSGDSYLRLVVFGYNQPPTGNFSRSNVKNRLKETLKPGKSYCVKMYLNLPEKYPNATDAFGIYFGDASLDTINYNARLPLTFLNPQVANPNGNFISDTMNWVLVTGTFVATGNEKYMLISNFKSDIATNTISVPTTSGQNYGCEYFVDAVSCIEYNLLAYAGPDKLIYLGDSAFIGRQPDFATDTGCTWYKLPNMTTSIDTISGLWVKPAATSTYVVRQQLDCSSLKWDTVVVTINTNYVGLDEHQYVSENINLFPNPTSGNLNISFLVSFPTDFKTYSITSTFGQLIREDEINLKNYSFIAQTSDLQQGLYQIHFKTSFGIVTKKFVKTN